MKFRLTVLIVFSLCLSNVFADEGMWLLGNLRKNKQTDRVMKELGLQLPDSCENAACSIKNSNPGNSVNRFILSKN